MIRRPPRSTLDRSSAASDVYKRQVYVGAIMFVLAVLGMFVIKGPLKWALFIGTLLSICLLYTSPSPRDRTRSRMPSSA